MKSFDVTSLIYMCGKNSKSIKESKCEIYSRHTLQTARAYCRDVKWMCIEFQSGSSRINQ